jgi:hypothetical protein
MLVRAFIMARGAMGEYMRARGRYGLAIWWTCLTGQLTGTRGM